MEHLWGYGCSSFQIALISKTYYENDARVGYKKEAPPVEPGIHGGDDEKEDTVTQLSLTFIKLKISKKDMDHLK